MKKTYGLPTFFAFYLFFVWSSDGEIQFHRDYIDQASCEAVAKTFKEEHTIKWKELESEEDYIFFKEDGAEVTASKCIKIGTNYRSIKIRRETTNNKFYSPEWKGKCIPKSEWN